MRNLVSVAQHLFETRHETTCQNKLPEKPGSLQ